MAAHRVRLRRENGAEITDLPPVCMRCGATATTSFGQTFLDAHNIFFRRQRVAMPVCEKHRFHLVAFRFLPLVFLSVAFSLILGLYLLDKVAQPGEQVMFYLWAGYHTLAVLYVIFVIILHFRQIRVVKIAERYIELTNVARPFVEAVEQEEEKLRRRFTQEDGEPFDASLGGDERILPGGDDAFQAK